MTDPNNTTSDVLIDNKNMFPLWIFADLFNGIFAPGKYWCFIGTHYPSALVGNDVEKYKECVAYLTSGNWKLEEMRLAKSAESHVGYGCGRNPSHAFREACYSSGYLKRTVTV